MRHGQDEEAAERQPRRVVDGANDNLTGCFMGVAVLRELEHTEVGVILTGSEETWHAAHRGDSRDMPAAILCFDTIHDPGLNHVLEDYYHTRRDSWNNLNGEGLENCDRATIRLIGDKDS